MGVSCAPAFARRLISLKSGNLGSFLGCDGICRSLEKSGAITACTPTRKHIVEFETTIALRFVKLVHKENKNAFR
jgi:hypothetical protein